MSTIYRRRRSVGQNEPLAVSEQLRRSGRHPHSNLPPDLPGQTNDPSTRMLREEPHAVAEPVRYCVEPGAEGL